MARILVVDDESDARQVLEEQLRGAGYEALSTDKGREALLFVQNEQIELVLLNLELPDVSGTKVCRALKEDSRTRAIPVVFVTERAAEIDRVVGFELGADDYVTKPFSMRELLLRIRVILGRYSEGESASTIRLGSLLVDQESHRAWVDSAEIHLTKLEFRLLVVLYEGRQRLQSRENLIDRIWGFEASVSARTIDAHVKRLREKLGPARDYIETIRGVGYRFANLTGTQS